MSAAAKDNRIKASMCQDAWLLPYVDTYDPLALYDEFIVKSTPHLHVHSSIYF